MSTTDFTSTVPRRILICGAGIAGPALAYYLSRIPHGPEPLDITVLERSAVPRVTGQAVDLRGPGVGIMRDMGIEAEVRQHSTNEKGIRKIDARGNTVAVFNATGDVQKQSLTSEFEILRGDLAQIVTDLALARPGVEVVYGDYVTALAQPGDGGPVRVEFANGRPAGEYDLVVGADGFLSRTRALASGRTAQEDVFDFGGAYVAYFTIPRIADDPPAHSQMFNAPGGRAVVLRPSPAGISCILMIARPGDAALVAAVRQDTTAQKAIFAHHFADIGWQTSRILSGIATTEDFYYQQIAQVRTPRWSFGRVALIGDAAYSPSGLTGMGTTLALYGAYTLAGELANAVQEGRSLPDALEAYERVARPYVREMQKIPPGAPGIALPQSRTGVWVLNTIAMLIYRLGIPRLVDLFLSNFGQKEDDKLQMYKWAE